MKQSATLKSLRALQGRALASMGLQETCIARRSPKHPMRRKLIGIIIAATLVASASALAQSIASAAPAATGAPSPATSAPAVAGPTRVGIVNIQQVIVNTTEGKREFETLNKKFEPKQTELSTLNKEIDGLKTQLQTQGDKMNEDAKATLVRQIESKQKVLQRNADDAQA